VTNNVFQSRLPGFLFFYETVTILVYDPNGAALVYGFNPACRDFCFSTGKWKAKKLFGHPFQSRLPGFLFFYLSYFLAWKKGEGPLQSRLPGFLFFYAGCKTSTIHPLCRFNPACRDFCFFTLAVDKYKGRDENGVSIPLAGIFVFLLDEEPTVDDVDKVFQSRLPGFLFFYYYTELVRNSWLNELCFNPACRDFCFSTPGHRQGAWLLQLFQSRLPGFLFFYRIIFLAMMALNFVGFNPACRDFCFSTWCRSVRVGRPVTEVSIPLAGIFVFLRKWFLPPVEWRNRTFQSRLPGFLFFYLMKPGNSCAGAIWFQSRLPGFLFFYAQLVQHSKFVPPPWRFQSRLPGFLFFYEGGAESLDKNDYWFQSRLPGFLFFYHNRRFRICRIFYRFQSRLPGFLFFYEKGNMARTYK